jgi:hypothetical protein
MSCPVTWTGPTPKSAIRWWISSSAANRPTVEPFQELFIRLLKKSAPLHRGIVGTSGRFGDKRQLAPSEARKCRRSTYAGALPGVCDKPALVGVALTGGIALPYVETDRDGFGASPSSTARAASWLRERTSNFSSALWR